MSLGSRALDRLRSDWRKGFLVFSLLYWTCFLLFAESHLFGEGVHTHLFFPTLLSEGSLNLADDFVAYPQGSPFALRFETLPTGYAANPFPFGSSLLQLPFLLVAWGWDRIWGLHRETGLHDFLFTPYLFAQILSTWFYVWMGAFLLGRTLDKLFRTGVGDRFLVVGAVIAATPLLNYLVHDPAYSHAYSFFAVSLFYFLWFRLESRDDFRSGVLVGAAGGLVFLVRWQDVLFLAPALAEMAGTISRGVDSAPEGRRRRQSLRFAMGGLLAFLVWVLPQCVYWNILYGNPFPVPPGSSIFSDDGPHFRDLLFSKRNGLFQWHPLTALATVGLVWMVYRTPRLRWMPLALILPYLFIASLADWSGSYSFGQRRFVGALPVWAMGLATLFSIRWKAWQWALRFGLVGLAVWNVLVFRAWHGGFFEGGRHSASRVMSMFWNAPELLFGDLFENAFFPRMFRNLPFSELAFLLAAAAFALLVGWVLIRCAGRPRIGKGSLAWAVLCLSIPLALGVVFHEIDRRGEEALQVDLSLSAAYPADPTPLCSVRIGKGSLFAGEVDALLLDSRKKLHLRFENPQPASALGLVAYLSSAGEEMQPGEDCLKLTVLGPGGEASATLQVGVHLDFPAPEFGEIRSRGGTLQPRTVERGQDGTLYFSYGTQVSFPPRVVRELILESLVPSGEIGVEAISFAPASLEEVLPRAPDPSPPIESPSPIRLEAIFNAPIPSSSLALGFSPGGRIEWRGIPFELSSATREACLSTGFEPAPLRFLAPIEPVACRAVHLLLGSAERGDSFDGPLARVRLHLAGGGVLEEPILLGRDVGVSGSVYRAEGLVDYWSAPEGSERSEAMAFVKTLLLPKNSGRLVGVEVLRDPASPAALILYAVTAVP